MSWPVGGLFFLSGLLCVKANARQTHLTGNSQNVDIRWFITEMRLEQVVYRNLSASSMKASLMAMSQTLRDQHSWPRRVKDQSMMSSATRKNAWSFLGGTISGMGVRKGRKGRTTSTHQPRMAENTPATVSLLCISGDVMRYLSTRDPRENRIPLVRLTMLTK